LDFPNEDLESLKDLGLTLVQAKIFLSLSQTGTMDAKAISQISNVARPDVYRALTQLQEAGLVEKEIDRPALFRTISTEDAFSLLMENQSRKHKELKAKTANLVSKYKKSNQSSFFNRQNFVFVPSRETLIKRLKKAIDNSQRSIEISTSCKRLSLAGYSLVENLQKAWGRGVKGRAVIDCCGEKIEIIKKFWRAPWAEIKYVPIVPRTVMAMYDKREVFVFTKPKAQLDESPALWSNVPSLVAMADDYFEILWSTAMENPEYHLDKTKPQSL
jgi:sugar-specific transcriptional regulator TrmB